LLVVGDGSNHYSLRLGSSQTLVLSDASIRVVMWTSLAPPFRMLLPPTKIFSAPKFRPKLQEFATDLNSWVVTRRNEGWDLLVRLVMRRIRRCGLGSGERSGSSNRYYII
jgi:hypothetical protein